jgi:hypothetical protein
MIEGRRLQNAQPPIPPWGLCVAALQPSSFYNSSNIIFYEKEAYFAALERDHFLDDEGCKAAKDVCAYRGAGVTV